MLNLKDFQYLTFNANENWYHGTGCQYPLVCPNGTRVKFLGVYRNFYGFWYEVEYDGRTRYVMPCCMNGNVMEKKEVFCFPDPASLTIRKVCILTDRNGKKYKLLNEKGELELL